RALSLHLLRYGAVRLEDQIRFRHRLAELLAADFEEERGRNQRPQLHDGSHRRELRALRCASGSRLRRRAEADGPALLHEFGVAEIRTARQSVKERKMNIRSLLLASVFVAAAGSAMADETSKPLPAPVLASAPSKLASENAVLAGGCFWGMQGVFQHLK